MTDIYTVKALSEYAVIPHIFRDFKSKRTAVTFARKVAKKYNHVYIAIADLNGEKIGFLNPGSKVEQIGKTWHI